MKFVSIEGEDDGEHTVACFVVMSTVFVKRDTFSLKQNHLTEFSNTCTWLYSDVWFSNWSVLMWVRQAREG